MPPRQSRGASFVRLVTYEGLQTYGWMAGRDMKAVAVGIDKSVQDDHIRARIGQVEYLGEKLRGWGTPIVMPIGGHGIFLDARAFLPHAPQEQYPAQALAAVIYLDSGVRTMERGTVSAVGIYAGPYGCDGREPLLCL